jgi:hypothetical protein
VCVCVMECRGTPHASQISHLLHKYPSLRFIYQFEDGVAVFTIITCFLISALVNDILGNWLINIIQIL